MASDRISSDKQWTGEAYGTFIQLMALSILRDL